MLTRIFNFLYRIKYKKEFSKLGNNSIIYFPSRIEGKENIEICNNVIIQKNAWLACLPLTGVSNPVLKIGDGCIIGNYNEIYSTKSIIIENNVLTADRVYISDNLHGYENPIIPIHKQSIVQKGEGVKIGEGSWIGVGACIIGASIGKHCVIGANAVVTHDIPDYSVAVGIPAKVIKRYNFEKNEWINIC